MNIFALSYDATEAAQFHMDRHVVKMPLESAQMLCTAVHIHGGSAIYKKAFVKHPCTIWAAKTRSNFDWLTNFGIALCVEYQYRYNRVHACRLVIEDCMSKRECIPEGELTTFAQAMPEEYKNECTLEAYREYYRKGKSHLAVWKGREKPHWY